MDQSALTVWPVTSAVLLKGLQDLAEHQQPYTKVVVGSPRADSTSPSSGQVQQVQIRVARLEESGATASSPMGALQIPVQIPVQITHVCEWWLTSSLLCLPGYVLRGPGLTDSAAVFL